MPGIGIYDFSQVKNIKYIFFAKFPFQTGFSEFKMTVYKLWNQFYTQYFYILKIWNAEIIYLY